MSGKESCGANWRQRGRERGELLKPLVFEFKTPATWAQVLSERPMSYLPEETWSGMARTLNKKAASLGGTIEELPDLATDGPGV